MIDRGTVVGMVSDRDLLTFVGNFEDQTGGGQHMPSRVEEIMTSPVHTLTPKDTVQQACRLMVEKQIHGIPLVLYEHVKAIITASDLLRLYVDPQVIGDSGKWRGRKSGEQMSRDLHCLSPDNKLLDAVNLMKEHHVRHIPITNEGVLVGIVSDRDVRLALGTVGSQQEPQTSEQKRHAQWPLKEIMRHPVETTTPAVKLAAIAERMMTRKISALPVLDEGGLVGIITDIHLLKALVDCDAV